MNAPHLEPPPRSNGLKIFLWIGGGLVALCLLCCGIGGFMAKDQIRFGMGIVQLQSAASAKYGPGTALTVTPDPDSAEKSLRIVLIPAKKPAVEDIPAMQDWAWKTYAEALASGSPRVASIAVGQGGGAVTVDPAWVVPIDEVIRRTGVAAPPIVTWNGSDGETIRVHVGSNEEPEAPKEPDDDK